MLKHLTKPFCDHIAGLLAQNYPTLSSVSGTEVSSMIQYPTKAKVVADLSIPCFQLAKIAKAPPPNLCETLCNLLKKQPFDGVEASNDGPFLNLVLKPTLVSASLFPLLTSSPLEYTLRSEMGKGKTVCIDMSSPNICKHLAFHHIRSTMIGNSLYHLYTAAGWRSVRINFLGDWGTAFGRLISGWKRKNLSVELLEQAENKISFLNELYVEISQAAKKDPSVAEEARVWSKKLEDGDEEARSLWQLFRTASLSEFEKVYKLLGVGFDSWKGEAYYEDKMEPLLKEIEGKGLTSQHEGATVIDLSKFKLKKPLLVKRSDGASLYATRDLTACDDRYNEFHFDRACYVVDAGQSLHFTEWFCVAQLLDRPYKDNLRHTKFGIMLIWNEDSKTWEKSASRNGVPLFLMDVLNEATAKAQKIIAEKNADINLDSEEGRTLAQSVGVGAVVFNDLKNSRLNDVKFKFEDAMNMQGFTGPYVQFTHARLCSIERKFAEQFSADAAITVDTTLLSRDDEKDVFLTLTKLQPALEKAVETDEPSVLCNTLLALSSSVSTWLSAGNTDRSARVLHEDVNLSAARLALVKLVRLNIAEALRLLGLRAPERM